VTRQASFAKEEMESYTSTRTSDDKVFRGGFVGSIEQRINGGDKGHLGVVEAIPHAD
jgi:hypothetical protein